MSDSVDIANEARRVERLVIVAWIVDRSEQYRLDSGCRVALEDIAAGLRNCDHIAAWDHGEPDDLIREESR